MSLIRQSLASLRRSPGTVLVAFLLLVVGTTSTLVSLSILDTVQRGGFTFDHLDRLKTIRITRPDGPPQRLGWRTFEIWSESARSFDWMGAMDPVSVTVESGGTARQVSGARVSEDFLAGIGATIVRGRTFDHADRSAESSVVLVSRTWAERQLGTVDSAVRSVIVIDGSSYSIIGVVDDVPLPSRDTSLWLPAWSDPDWSNVRRRGGIDSWYVIGSLQKGRSVSSAADELRTLATAAGTADPDVRFVIDPLTWFAAPSRIRRAAVLVLGGALILVLITAANVAKLLHLRAQKNWGGLAIRLAIGASTARLSAQLFVESILVSAAAVAVSISIAPFLLRRIEMMWPELPLGAPPGPWLMAAATLTALASALTAASFSALSLRRIRVAEVLQGQARVSRSTRAVELLATFQIALAVLLIGTGGLLLKSGWELMRVDPGYDADSVAMIQISVPRVRSEGERLAFHRSLLERLGNTPGVQEAAIIEDFFTGEGRSQTIALEDDSAVTVPITLDAISPSFLRTMRIPLVSGRSFEPGDDAQAPGVAIVNRRMEQVLGGSVAGRRIRIGNDEEWLTVVGVVADAHRAGREREPGAQVFRPLAQRPSRNANLLIRSDVDVETLLETTREIVASIEPAVPLYGGATLEATESRASLWRSTLQDLLVILGLIGISLAAIATWAVHREHVIQRDLEIAVRLSVGADGRSIVRLLLAEFTRRAAIGIGLGTLALLIVGRLMKPVLFATRSFEPSVFLASVAIMLTFVLVVSLPSVVQASRIDPAARMRGGS